MTASMEARHGCTWSGYENMTNMTMAALPIVDAMEGVSRRRQKEDSSKKNHHLHIPMIFPDTLLPNER